MNRRDVKNFTKTQMISAKLRDMAVAKGPDAKLPTRDQLCLSLGTSRGTIDDVLRELLARNIIYSIRGSGIYVSPHIHRKKIAVLLDASYFETQGSSPFWGILQGMITKEAQQRALRNKEEVAFYIVHSSMDEKISVPDALEALLSSGEVDGAIGIGTQYVGDTWMQAWDVPMVDFAGSANWRVGIDNDAILKLGVNALKESGCRKIGYLEAVLPSKTMPDDMAPYSNRPVFDQVMRDHNLPVLPEYIADGNQFLDNPERTTTLTMQEQGFQSAMRLFSASNAGRPDGLLIMNDMITNGVLVALNRLGIRPGIDVKIATHSNVGSSVLFGNDENLTLIKVDPYEIVMALYDLLDEVLSDTPPLPNFGKIVVREVCPKL